jgi:hypothetical protein
MSSSSSVKDDAALIREGEDHVTHQRFILAAQLFEQVSAPDTLTKQQRRIIEIGQRASASMKQMLLPNPEDQGWKKQGEVHGNRDTMIYYRVKHPENIIVCRMETPLESSLLCPLLSVINESELYHTWMPHWDFPKLGLSESRLLKDLGRGHQIISLRIDTPFPFANRECILHGVATDSIDGDDNAIILSIQSMDTGNYFEMDVPAPERGYRRAAYTGDMLFRPCPVDHPVFRKSKANYPVGEKLLLISMDFSADGRVAGVPLSIINFITRTVIGKQWGTLLKIAEDVKSGIRVDHQKAIEEKKELYGWVEERVRVMLAKMDQEEVGKESA